MIFGVAATKTAVVIAETKGTGDKFAITAIRPVPFEVRAGDNLAELLRCLTIIFGTPTRFGNMAAQMRNFLDQTGGLWVKGGLVGKVGSVFASTGTGSGNESPIISFVTTLMHHGMVYVGLPYEGALVDLGSNAKPPNPESVVLREALHH